MFYKIKFSKELVKSPESNLLGDTESLRVSIILNYRIMKYLCKPFLPQPVSVSAMIPFYFFLSWPGLLMEIFSRHHSPLLSAEL